MDRISLFVLLAMLVGSFAGNVAAAAQHTTIAQADQAIYIGDTKKKVEAKLGKPDRKSRDENIWYYTGKLKITIEFTDGKVSSFPGAQG